MKGFVLLLPAGLALLVVLALFVVVTEGRWFGKGLLLWVYDRAGPWLFAAVDEADLWRTLIAQMGLRGDERVLDAGTAVGAFPLTLAATPGFHGRVTGLDWSPRMIERARAEAARRGLGDRVHFQVADLRGPLPFAGESFDVVVCLGVLEALPHADAVLAEFRRVLRPGGLLVVSLYRRPGPAGTGRGEAWYRRSLGALGFTEVRTAPFRRLHGVLLARVEGGTGVC